MARKCSDVRDVKRRALPDFVLNAKAVAVYSGHVTVTRGADNVFVALHRGVRARQRWQVGDVIGGHLRSLHDRRIVKHSVEDEVSLDPVVHHAKTATQNRLVIAVQIVRKAKTRLWHNSTAVPSARRYLALVRVAHALERIAAPRNDLTTRWIYANGGSSVIRSRIK